MVQLDAHHKQEHLVILTIVVLAIGGSTAGTVYMDDDSFATHNIFVVIMNFDLLEVMLSSPVKLARLWLAHCSHHKASFLESLILVGHYALISVCLCAESVLDTLCICCSGSMRHCRR